MKLIVNKDASQHYKNTLNISKLFYFICLLASFVAISKCVSGMNNHLNSNKLITDNIFYANILEIFSIIVWVVTLTSIRQLRVGKEINLLSTIIWYLYISFILLIQYFDSIIIKNIELSYIYLIFNSAFNALIILSLLIFRKNIKYIYWNLLLMQFTSAIYMTIPIIAQFFKYSQIINIFDIFDNIINIILISSLILLTVLTILIIYYLNRKMYMKMPSLISLSKFVFIFELFSMALLSFFIFEFEFSYNIDIYTILCIMCGLIILAWTILYFKYIYKILSFESFKNIFRILLISSLIISIFTSSSIETLQFSSEKILAIWIPIILSLCITSVSNLSYVSNNTPIFIKIIQSILTIIYILLSINISDNQNQALFMNDFINIDLIMFLIILIMVWTSMMSSIFFEVKNSNLHKVFKRKGA